MDGSLSKDKNYSYNFKFVSMDVYPSGFQISKSEDLRRK